MNPETQNKEILNAQENFGRNFKEIVLEKQNKGERYIPNFFITTLLTFLLLMIVVIGNFSQKYSEKHITQAVSSLKVIDSNIYMDSSLNPTQRNIVLSQYINQYEQLNFQNKTLSLLLMTSMAINNSVNLNLSNHATEYYQKHSNVSEEVWNTSNKLSKLDKSYDNSDVSKRQLNQLMKMYKDLPDLYISQDNFINKKLEEHLYNDSYEYLKYRIAQKLYALNSTIENRTEIQQILNDGFTISEFLKDKKTYWKDKFSAKYGKEPPEYLLTLYSDNMEDNLFKEKIENFIQKYK